jgi:hypothetical protein
MMHGQKNIKFQYCCLLRRDVVDTGIDFSGTCCLGH